MNDVILFRDSYVPNSATTNRFLSFVRGLSEMGVNTQIVFIRPNVNSAKCECYYENVQINYLWDGKNVWKSKFKYLQQLIWIFFFLLNVSKGTRVIVFGTSDLLFVFLWFKYKIKIFHEITEYPNLGLDSQSIIVKWLHKLYIYSCRKISGLFVISEPLKYFFISCGVRENRISIINMTVDSSRFDTLKKLPVNRYIAYCGAVTNSKDGVDVLIRAFEKVRNQISNVKLYIIGNYPFEKDEIANSNLVKKLNLSDDIVFTGSISADSMPQLLKNAEVLVLARPNNIQAYYGFPTKLGEYLSTGNPVVVTSVGDIPKFLSDGINAYIAKPDNIDEIAEKIVLALTAPEAKDIGILGRAVSEKSFNYLIETTKIINHIF